MSLADLIRWGWRHDRQAVLLPVVIPCFVAGLAIVLEVIA